jgi:subtilisin-like proprotein convertase family protein
MRLPSIFLAAAASFAFGLASAAPITYSSAGPVQIADLATASSSITIDVHGLVQDIDALVNITHSFDADLVLSLTHGGVTVLLSDRNGGAGGAGYAGTLFDDGAAIAIGAGDAYAPYTGAFRPEEALSAFIGHDIFGTWTLSATDMEAGDSGVIDDWSLAAQVPEPGALALFGVGLVALGSARRRRRATPPSP